MAVCKELYLGWGRFGNLTLCVFMAWLHKQGPWQLQAHVWLTRCWISRLVSVLASLISPKKAQPCSWFSCRRHGLWQVLATGDVQSERHKGLLKTILEVFSQVFLCCVGHLKFHHSCWSWAAGNNLLSWKFALPRVSNFSSMTSLLETTACSWTSTFLLN